jgi:RimJ/RimL family protein N-acetyltransferase
MIIDTPLTNGTIRLESLTSENISRNYLNWLSNPIINQFLEVRFSLPLCQHELEDYVSTLNDSKDVLMLGIFSTVDNLHVGNIKLGPIDYRHKRADIGFLIGDIDYHGRGFATAAISLVVSYAFEVLQLNKVTAGCYAPNVASARTLDKAGFQMDAIQRRHWRLNDDFVDGLVWAIYQ